MPSKPEEHEKTRQDLTRKINDLLAERDKIAKFKAPIAEKLRKLEGQLRFDKENKNLIKERDELKAEQFVIGGEVRRVRSELQKLKKQWIANESAANIAEQREDNRSQPSATYTEDY